MKRDKLRVGVIGIGKMGSLRAGLVRSHENLELACVSDIDESKSKLFDVPFFKEPSELLAQDIDAVFICTYNNVVAGLTIEAINAEKHVFCEKPPGFSVEDVERVIEAERSKPGLKVKYGLNHRYHYSVIEAKKLIDSKRFGKILWMRGIYGKAGGVQFDNIWRNDAGKAGGGILLDQGIHMLDLFEYFCGGFNQIQSYVTTLHWNIPVEDNVFTIMKNNDNQVAFFHSSSTQWKHKFSLEIALEGGYINLNGILSSTRSYGDETLTFAKKQFEDTSFALGKPREETIYFDRDDSWTLEVNDFVDTVMNDSPVESCNTSDALKLMKLIEKIYKASR